MSFIPCPTCARHVKHTESACPFCDAKIEYVESNVSAPIARDRSALLFGAVLASAIGVGACNAGVPAPAYGGPPPPDTATQVTVTDAATTPPVMVAAYGAPAPTAMLVDAGPPAPVAAYGAPAPTMDAGTKRK